VAFSLSPWLATNPEFLPNHHSGLVPILKLT
jgi:hypothetical protein